jgi:uncharacterized membrane protein
MRNYSIDTIRGLAILVMILANSFPYIYENEEVSLWIRVLFSLAAPIFIFISGYTLQMNLGKGKQEVQIVKRIIQILLIAIIIDVFIWRVLPFQSFDVLYLISFSLLLLLIFNKLTLKIKIGLFFLFVSIQLFLIYFFEYRFEVTDNSIFTDDIDNNTLSLSSSGLRWLYDGWFPVFPWFILAFAGSLFKSSEHFFIKYAKLFLLKGVLFFAGWIIMLKLYPEFINEPRDGYQELFYPAYGMYILAILGVIFICSFAIIKTNFSLPLISSIGRVSLFVYLLHCVLLFFLEYFSEIQSPELVLIFYAILNLTIGLLVQKYHLRLKKVKLIKPLLYVVGL